MKHTQGEWKVEGNNKSEILVYTSEAIIAFMSINNEEAEANAKLIAAAPDLLKALQNARDTLLLCTLVDKSEQSKKTLTIVEAAITKAT